MAELSKAKRPKKKKMKKTAYCSFCSKCDREEDCFNGAYCPVFVFNPQCAGKEVDQYDKGK